MDFVEFIQDELRNRDWTRADLSRKSGIAAPQITRVLNREQNPGKVFIEGIARAFNLPLESVYQKAGVLPTKSKRDELIEEAEHLFSQLESEDSKRIAINFLRMLQGDKKKR